MMKSLLAREKGTWVLLSFIAFFGVIVAVNTIFITTALKTHSGVVTDKPYERGLAYNDTLEKARMQPYLHQAAEFNNGVLRWKLADEQGQPIEADVEALLFRSVRDGYDFKVRLEPIGQGIYEAKVTLPLKGQWEAQLKAQWKTLQYQTRFSFVAT